MIHEVQENRACGELVKFQEKEIQKGLDIEVKLSTELAAANALTAFEKASAKEEHARFDNQVMLTKVQKKKKRKWIFICFGLMGYIVIDKAVE